MKVLFEHNGGIYCKEGYYLIPQLTLPTREENDIGIYGERYLHFLQESFRLTYTNLLTSGVLNEYLSEIDKQAQERFYRIVKQLQTTQCITEQLKIDDLMEWIGKMNFIRQQAEEIVLNELIYK